MLLGLPFFIMTKCPLDDRAKIAILAFCSVLTLRKVGRKFVCPVVKLVPRKFLTQARSHRVQSTDITLLANLDHLKSNPTPSLQL
mmetsp:Transcript_3431/g.21488  ORF Transcript_3431/g.21488 Transcript_3431/m.21488 type:complete len:85 (+) Transcript_3431:704-958(+)